MLKSDRGITVISLVIMIIVMLILLRVGITTTIDLVRDTNMKKSITTMLLVQQKASSIRESYDFDSDANALVGTPTSLEDESLIIDSSEGIDPTEKWYKWGPDELSEFGIETNMVSEGDTFFLVNYDTLNVIYNRGVDMVNGVRVWTLSEMMDSQNL